MSVALLGDRSGHRSHLELDALRASLPVETEWVPTDSADDNVVTALACSLQGAPVHPLVTAFLDATVVHA